MGSYFIRAAYLYLSIEVFELRGGSSLTGLLVLSELLPGRVSLGERILQLFGHDAHRRVMVGRSVLQV